MDSDDSDQMPVPTAFYIKPVKEGDIDLSVPPATGEEYLQRVMLEAKKCDAVVTAQFSTSVQEKIKRSRLEDAESENIKSPLAPPIQWQEQQIADFSHLRQQIACLKTSKQPAPPLQLPLYSDQNAWKKLCFGDDDEGTKPFLSILLQIGQPMVDQLLEWHDSWLAEKSQMTHSQGRWLYALMACVEQPLHPDTCSTLRSIVRTCQQIRSVMVDPDPTVLASVNLIICLVARYFCQTDLADG